MSYMAYLHTPYGPQQVIPIEIKPRKIEGDVTNTSELEKKLKEYIDTRVNEISNVISKLPVDVTKINDLKKQIKDEIKAEISAYMCSDCVKVTDYMKDKRDFLNTFNNFVKDEFKKQISNLESRINMKGNSVIDRVTKLENEAKSLGEIITSSGLTTFQSQLTSIKSQLASGPTVAVDIKVLEQIANLEKKFMDEITRIEGKISAEIDMKLAGYKNVDTDTLSDECKKYVDKIKTALETQINDKDEANLSERTKILQRIKAYEDKLDAHIRGPHTELIKELEELSGKIGTLNAEHRNINTRLDEHNAEHGNINATLDGINDKLLDLETDHRNIAGKLLTLQQLQDDFNLFKNQIYDMYNQLIIVARAILIEQGERINNANNSIKELNELVKTLMKLLIKTNFMNKDEVKTVEKQMDKINNAIVKSLPQITNAQGMNVGPNMGINAQELLRLLQNIKVPSSSEMKQPSPRQQPALPQPPARQPPALPQPPTPPQPALPQPVINKKDEQLRAVSARLEAEQQEREQQEREQQLREQQLREQRERIERERQEVKRQAQEAKQREKEAKDRRRAELNNELIRLEKEKIAIERKFVDINKQIIKQRLERELRDTTDTFNIINQQFKNAGKMKPTQLDFVKMREQHSELDSKIKRIEKQLTPEGLELEIQKMIEKELEPVQGKINEITDELGQLGGGDDDRSATSDELTQYNLLSATSEDF